MPSPIKTPDLLAVTMVKVRINLIVFNHFTMQIKFDGVNFYSTKFE
jgi:hypothetical protein